LKLKAEFPVAETGPDPSVATTDKPQHNASNIPSSRCLEDLPRLFEGAPVWLVSTKFPYLYLFIRYE
jgi:hypothetical protein